MSTMYTPDGGPAGGGGATTPRSMVPPSYYRAPMFPYADLPAQLTDALGLAGRGAGQYGNMNTPLLQAILGSKANVGGGLLGMSAYGMGANPFSKKGIAPPPGGLGGLLRPNPPVSGGMPPIGTPRGGGPPVAPPPPFQQPGSRGANPGTTPPPKSAPITGGLFNPGSGATDVNAMVAHFNSLGSDAQKANYVRAIDQYSLGKGGAANLGAALQQGLRQSMGQGAFDAWSGTHLGATPGAIGREGLPSWLVSALGG